MKEYYSAQTTTVPLSKIIDQDKLYIIIMLNPKHIFCPGWSPFSLLLITHKMRVSMPPGQTAFAQFIDVVHAYRFTSECLVDKLF
ncbi:MAG: hypothetical protein P8Y60_13890 [Calditrichota bacterium]